MMMGEMRGGQGNGKHDIWDFVAVGGRSDMMMRRGSDMMKTWRSLRQSGRMAVGP